MPYTTLKLDREDPLAIITFNRPEKRNAISTQMIQEILAALDEIEDSPVRAAIITGAGSAFSAGMDLEGLRALAEQSHEQNLEDSRRMATLFHRIYSFPKPLIAAVNGHAIAGGCGLATLCDFTLAVPAAKFGYTEGRIGFLPALVSVFLVRQIGEKRAPDLVLTRRLVGAQGTRPLPCFAALAFSALVDLAAAQLMRPRKIDSIDRLSAREEDVVRQVEPPALGDVERLNAD